MMTNCCAPFCILFFISCVSLDCNRSSQRNGVDIYKWDDIEYGICKLPSKVPFIIINSALNEWGQSTMKHIIKTIKASNSKVNVEYRRSNCEQCGFHKCNIHLCHEFVNTFSTPAYAREHLTENRIHSFWYKYELNIGNVLGLFPHQQFENEQCINNRGIARKSVSISKAIKKAKSLSLSRDQLLYNNYSNYTYSAIKFATTWKLQDHSQYEMLIKYKNIQPFFKLFTMKREYDDIHIISAWMGSSSYITNFHYDQANNMFFMIKGNKTFQMVHNILFNDNFVIFPFFHFYFLNFAKYEDKYLDYQNIKLYTNEILYIPSYWYHRVINGKYDTYGLNVWIRNHDSLQNIQTYQFSNNLRQNVFANIKNKWQEILYFLQQLQFRIFGNHSLFEYFSKMYPILNDIRKYHMEIGDRDSMNNDNLNWILWFIELDNMLKCGAVNEEDIDVNKLLINNIIRDRYNTLYCPCPDMYSFDKEWDYVIEDIINILFKMQNTESEGTAQLELAQFTEKMLYLITQDIMYLPVFVSLHNL